MKVCVTAEMYKVYVIYFIKVYVTAGIIAVSSEMYKLKCYYNYYNHLSLLVNNNAHDVIVTNMIEFTLIVIRVNSLIELINNHTYCAMIGIVRIIYFNKFTFHFVTIYVI